MRLCCLPQVVACGSFRLLCESPAVQANADCWTQLLSGLVHALEASGSAGGGSSGSSGLLASGAASGGAAPEDEKEEGDVEAAGFDGEGMNKLHFTGAAQADLVPEVTHASFSGPLKRRAPAFFFFPKHQPRAFTRAL